ncbi:SRPBCC family protein [Scleromatobacter humisilvae]|uniref:SRPBCC family protein n=1 Tax=Scleromatobacter humisilvae TaxID=2897159 RepID=A0A9X1YD56_9BURK|nr:SRPBCC family protein [Scleromatobacter humisilvae]MCK9684354.1 SRPBCC family protein [Scleromatobacter humisilvae]
MRWLVRVAAGLVAVVLLAVVAGFLLPDTYRVERSAVVNAPPERIYPLVAAPKRWPEWSMWNRRDPAMAMTFFGPESGAGAGWSWDSKTEGKGRMTFLTADPARGFTYQLYFPDYDSTSTGDIRFEPQGDATKITWTNAGSVGRNPLMHYMARFMDRMVGPDFEAGLANLKTLAERR